MRVHIICLCVCVCVCVCVCAVYTCVCIYMHAYVCFALEGQTVHYNINVLQCYNIQHWCCCYRCFSAWITTPYTVHESTYMYELPLVSVGFQSSHPSLPPLPHTPSPPHTHTSDFHHTCAKWWRPVSVTLTSHFHVHEQRCFQFCLFFSCWQALL